jgi:uroporphyrin-III C-methyltransferase/precorrin-2 dehydrogenase/sirohydrochlorin ferrochelatase
VTFVSGHAAAGSPAADWAALARPGHTLAIYMGAAEAVAVRDRLMAAGADPALPVAVIENGTRPDERVSTGRLADLARLAARHTVPGAGPSLLVVGEVAALAAAEPLPLAKVS